MSTPEGRIKAKFRRLIDPLIKEQKVFCLMPVQTRWGRVGLDYHLIVGGLPVCIEAKKDAKTDLSPRQKATVEYLQRCGARVLLIYDNWSINYAVEFIRGIAR